MHNTHQLSMNFVAAAKCTNLGSHELEYSKCNLNGVQGLTTLRKGTVEVKRVLSPDGRNQATALNQQMAGHPQDPLVREILAMDTVRAKKHTSHQLHCSSRSTSACSTRSGRARAQDADDRLL